MLDIDQMTYNFLRKWGERTKPSMVFEGRTPKDVETWSRRLKAKIREQLLEFPEPADLKPKFLGAEEQETFRREKWIIQTERDCFMPLYLLVPRGIKGKAPAILCCHGHGPYGKDPIAGVHFNDGERMAQIRSANYNYGEQMAQRGYVTICPDWRSFGERIAYGKSDHCNQHFIQHLLLGRTLLGANVFDGMRAIDFLLTRREVDAERIGCMGLSFGGTMTTYMTLLEDRIRAADIICYATTTMHYAINRTNICGSQFVPGIYRYADVGDIIAAICPKPLLIESGNSDTCFWIHSAMEAHEKVRTVYRTAGVEDRLWIEIFPGEHRFAGGKAFEFFDRHLKRDG